MKLRLLFSALLISSSLLAEVNFQTLDWQQAKDQCKKESKFLFVDCYTEWCGWCKVMDKQTFPDAQVSQFMNDHFVSVKIDMEKGFGIDLSHKYNVTGYPTFLVFNPSGDLVNVSLGYQDTAPFLAMLKESTDPSSQKIISGYSQKIPEEYPALLTKMWSDKTYHPSKDEVAAFLNQSKDHFSESYWSVLSRFYSMDSSYFQQISDNRTQYRQLFGKDAVDDIFFSHLYKNFASAIKNKDEAQLNDFLKNLSAYDLPDDADTKLNYKLTFYQQTGDWKNMMNQVDEYIKLHGEDDLGLNEYCWAVYEKCDDPAIVQRATDIMSKVTAAHPLYEELDTYAALLYKSKNYSQAEKTAQAAIEIGKKDSSDVSSTEELLKKIQAENPR
ncbi:MAG: thioredoxin family protein [Chitinophagales bacterium]